MDVGWLGLGAMGAPMARRMMRAHRLVAYDPTPERVDELGPAARAAGDPSQASDGCDVLAIAVASPAQAEEALFGLHGAAPSLRPDARLLLLSTLGPAWVRSAAARLPQVQVVDAPVSGGAQRAAEGTLLVMAAGTDPISVELLEELGEVVTVGEEPGQGQAMKIVNQVLCGVHIGAAAEALALAGAMGIDPTLAWSTLRRGAAASFMLEDRGSRMVHDAAGPVRSSMSLFVKDLDLVLEEARSAGQPMPLSAAAAELFTAAAAAGRASHDDSELYDFLRSLRSD